MGNVVSFLFIARDKYTRVAQKAKRATDKLTRGFGKLDKKVKHTERTVRKTSNSFVRSMKNMAGAMVGFFGAREFFTTGMRFQDAIADLSAITGAAGGDLSKLKEDIFRLADAAAISQDQVALAFAQVASAKSELLKDPKALAVVTEQVLLLANAAGISVPEAMQASVGALNQFSKGAEDAGRFVNVMAAGAKVGSSLVHQTAAAMVDAGFAASSAGMSFEQTNAALQVLAKSELKGARAGVALRNTLAIMDDVLDGKFGPSVIGINASLDKFASFNLTNNQLMQVFGRESKDAAGFLIKNRRLFKQYTKELTGTNVAQEQADKRLATFSARMRRLGVTLSQKIIKTFEKLEPILTKQGERFTAFIEAIKPEQVTAFGDSLAALLEVAIILGDAFKVVLSVIKGIGTAIGELAAQIATGNFSKKLGTSFQDAFSFGGKFLGVFEKPEKLAAVTGEQAIPSFAADVLEKYKLFFATAQEQLKPGQLNAAQSSRTDINLNLRAPEGTIESVKSKTTGKVSGLNVGMNMVTAQ